MLILAPSAMAQFKAVLNSEADREKLSVSKQATPLGMGDAIFGAEPYWSAFDSISDCLGRPGESLRFDLENGRSAMQR